MLCIWYAAPNQPGSLSAAYSSILFNPSLLYKEKDPFNTFASGFHIKNHKITMSHLLFFFFPSQKHSLFLQMYVPLPLASSILK